MEIRIKKPDEAEMEAGTGDETSSETEPAIESATEPAEMPSDSAESADGMRPKFKKAMDSYEEFMNGYCNFMKKYSESDGTDLGLLADCANYVSKYADVAENFEAWDSEEMNAAETAYFIPQVQ